MDPKQIAASPPAEGSDLCPQATASWRKISAQMSKIPITARVLLCFFLFAAVLMGIHTALAGKDSSFRLKVQHSFRGAQLSVWVDGDLTYSARLIGTPVKKFGLLPSSIQGSLSETFPVSSGAHQVRVRIVSEDGVVQENSIKGDFDRNSQPTLAVNVRRNDLSLNWQGSAMPIAEAASSGTGWFSRYTGTLLVTVAGSIVSALTGYMIREIPKQIGSRTGEIPKI
jgi:hypothetical protein